QEPPAVSHTEAPISRPRVLIMAFQGWSDAGDATTEVLQHLGGLMDGEVLHAIGSEGYVDFQVHRPKIMIEPGGDRRLDWPDTRLIGPGPGASNVDDPSIETIRRIDGSPVSGLFLLAG